MAIVAAAAAAYGFRRAKAGAPTFLRVERQEASPTLGRPLMTFGYWVLSRAGARLASAGVAPDAVSWAGLALAVSAGAAVASGWFGVAALSALLSGCCDALDGMVAGLAGKRSAGGAVLDSALDRYADFALLFGAALFFRGRPLFMSAALLAVFGSFMISYAAAKAEAIGKVPTSGMMKRPERWVWLLSGLLASALIRPWQAQSDRWAWPFAAAVALVAICSNVSAANRFRALRAAANGGSRA